VPPLPAVAQVAKLVFRYLLGEDSNVLNRLFVEYTPTISLTDALALSLAEAAGSAWGTHLAPLLSSQVTLESVEATDLSPASGAQAVADFSTAGGGTPDTDMGAEMCLVVKFIPDKLYRGGHPRWYQSGLSSGSLNDPQTWKTATLNAWGSGFTNFINEILTWTDGGNSLMGQVCPQYYHGNLVVTDLAGYAHNQPQKVTHPNVLQISSITTNPKVGSQRRRSLQSG